MSALAQWLRAHGFEQYESLFADNDVDLAALQLLSEADLAGLGISLGHRKKMLHAIAGLQANDSAPAPSSPNAAREHDSQTDSGERRQLTILFCDLVGSTALSREMDPEQLRELMHRYQQTCGQVVQRYDGHVAQYLGDGLMVYFGWPRAHEDDAERAVRAALEIAAAVAAIPASPALQVRAGIATGPVVVGETGNGDASVPKVAVGETPNLAARVQGLAQPGQVVIAPSTRKLLGTSFELKDLGQHALKGIVEPVSAWQVTSVRASDGRFDAARGATGITPLVGREEEMALLTRRWRSALEAEGQIVLICGEPGIGKSRIARAMRDQLDAGEYLRMTVQCSPYHAQSALYPLIDHLERAAGFGREDRTEDRLDKLERLLGPLTDAPAFAETCALLAALLSLPLDRYPPLEYSAQKQKEKTLQALAEYICGQSRKGPVLLLLEDAHWLDPTTQEFLDLFAPRIARLRLLLLMTYRPEYAPRWTGDPHVSVLTLNRLNRRLGTELTRRAAGGKRLPPEVLEQILAKTDGVPLFVEELTRTMIESGYLVDRGDHYDLTAPLPDLAIPSTLHDSLMARLDRLAPVKETAQLAACVGREFSHELIAAVSPLAEGALNDALDQLVHSQLIFRQGTPPRATYTFKHALVQDAAYDSILRSRRQSFHHRIAETLEARFPEIVETRPEVIADHYSRAGQPARAVDYWLRGGIRSRHRVAAEEGLRHLARARKALSQCPEHPRHDRVEFEIQRNLGLLYFMREGYQSSEAETAMRRAGELIDQAQDDVEVYSVHRALLASVYHRGINAEMQVVAEAALEYGERHEGPVAKLNANIINAVTDMWSARWRRATDYSRNAGHYLDPHLSRTLHRDGGFDPRIERSFVDGYCLWLLGYEDQARVAAEAGILVATEESDAYGMAMAYTYSGADLHQWMCDFEATSRYAAVAIQVANEHHGFRNIAHISRVHWHVSQARLGDLRAGIEHAIRALEDLIAVGQIMFVPRLVAEVAELLALDGRYDQALQLLNSSPDRKQKGGRPTRFPEIFRVEGILLAALRREREAEFCLREAVAIAHEDESLAFELRAGVELARFLAQRKRLDEVRPLLESLVAAIPEAKDRPDMQAARELLASGG
jgi:class 3 adenylate cyclase/tetratricopeptide (TPR) repeat protein